MESVKIMAITILLSQILYVFFWLSSFMILSS
jgi:hypothetical protein